MTNPFAADSGAWAALDQLLERALDVPGPEREAWLASLGAAERELVPALRELLQAEDRRSPLDTLPRFELPMESGAGLEGTTIGRFRLVRQLAEGGMGTVWLAERADGLIRTPVALKLPRGTWNAGFAERFEREREILGTLSHPHIARLLDAGVTADGQPWLALEYVEGWPIDAWIRDRNPPLPQRLRLVLEVMGAVSYAHGRLIVHRDLKPSNILVTPDGHARLLDFGIAKLIESGETPQSGLTERAGPALTPDYASPEQILGETIGVTSDVYSLGVVLFEVLAGARPYSLKRGRIEEGIRQVEPPRPSEVAPAAVAKLLRGDLDTIVAKALKKDPAGRYATMNEFAEDLERFLGGRPVRARPDSAGYRLARFVGRHRVAAAASVAVALSLVGGVAATAWQAAVARAERLRAEKRVEDVRRMANAMIMDFHDAIVPLAGSTPARKLVLERAVAFLDRLALDAPGDPALERELVEAYRRLGRVQGFRGSSSLGDHAGAKASFSKALRLLEALIDAGARDDWTRLQHPGVLKDLANAEWSLGEYEAALAHLQIARERIGSVLAERPDDVDALRTAGHVEYMQGDVLRDLGRLSDALEVYRSSLGRFRVLQRRNPPDPSPESRRLLAISLDKLGDALQAAGDLTAAAAHFREAFDLRTALLEQAPDSAEARRDVCTSFMRMGDSFLARKDPGRALALYQQAMEMARRKLVADPQSAQAQRDVAVTSMRIGNALAEQASRERGAAARAAKWREARARFVEAEKVHLAMKERGQWMAPDAPMLARYRAGIDRCDAALRAGR